MREQTFDSDYANDAFASLWGKGYQAPPSGDSSTPIDNGSNYRDDLGKIASDGFNLVRLYNWDPSRGTAPDQAPNYTGLDHINFLNYAQSLGLKVVVPVSDYFLSDDVSSWNYATLPGYSFSSAPAAIQNDFNQFIASITDPATGKISTAIHSIAVGNEGNQGEGLQDTQTTASNFLARTIWWVKNLHDKTGLPITATFSNADQGAGSTGSWFNDLVAGVQAGDATPLGWYQANKTFLTTVTGLAAADPNFASYYYNSVNIGQASTQPPFGNGLADTLALYDNTTTQPQQYPEQQWPFISNSSYEVPLLLMEVFATNRNDPAYPTPQDQAVAAVNQAKSIEDYLLAHKAGTPDSTTNLMGYNYFEFNDEPALGKYVGLYQYGTTPQPANPSAQPAQTGTSSIFYITNPTKGFPNLNPLPVYALTATLLPDGKTTLAEAWAATFAHVSVTPLLAARPDDGSGLKAFTFAVSRTGDISMPETVNYSVAGNGINPADAADFLGGVLPTGLISFAAGEIVKVLTIYVNGDATVEPDNGFSVALTNPSGGLAVVDGSADGTILNDAGAKAHDDAYVILQGHSLTADATTGLLANDENVSAGAAAVLSGVTHGQLQLNADGGLSYTPNAGFNGVDSFSYYAFGANGQLDTGHASIYVAPVNVGATTTLNLLALNPQEQVATLYVAFLGRAPDAPGFEYWVNQLNQNLQTQSAKVALINIAGSFAASPEANAQDPLLARGATDAEIAQWLENKYKEALDRKNNPPPPDDPGMTYWLNELKKTQQTPQDQAQVVVNILNGAQDTAAGKDIGCVWLWVAVSLAYVDQQELHGTVWAGASDIVAATALLHGVTADPQSLLTGVKTAEMLIADHA